MHQNNASPPILQSSVNVTFIDKEGQTHQVKGKVGDNVLYLAHRYEIELEGMSEFVGNGPLFC